MEPLTIGLVAFALYALGKNKKKPIVAPDGAISTDPYSSDAGGGGGGGGGGGDSGYDAGYWGSAYSNFGAGAGEPGTTYGDVTADPTGGGGWVNPNTGAGTGGRGGSGGLWSKVRPGAFGANPKFGAATTLLNPAVRTAASLEQLKSNMPVYQQIATQPPPVKAPSIQQIAAAVGSQSSTLKTAGSTTITLAPKLRLGAPQIFPTSIKLR